MTPELVVQLARRSFEATLLLAAPLLLFSLVVGLAISVFQAVTSINEATLAFAEKVFDAARQGFGRDAMRRAGDGQHVGAGDDIMPGRDDQVCVNGPRRAPSNAAP